MTDSELGYFAAVLDLNGVMSIPEYKGRRRPIIEVRQSDRRILDELASAFGGSVLECVGHGKATWYWRKAGMSARTVVALVRPYLKLRAARADEILRWTAMRRGQARVVKRLVLRSALRQAGMTV